MRNKGKSKRPVKNVLRVNVEKKRQQGQKAWQWALYGFCGVVLLSMISVGTYMATEAVFRSVFYENSDFELKKIVVDSKGKVSREEILEAARIREGQNLLALNLRGIRKRVEAMPYISKARVERILPSTLILKVEERVPVARLRPTVRGTNQLSRIVYYLDNEGYVMRPKAGEKILHLPLITGVMDHYVREGDKIDREEVISALVLLQLAELSTVKDDVDLDHVQVHGSGYLNLRTNHRGVIRLRTDYLVQQLARLGEVINFSRKKGLIIRTVDFTPDRNVPATFF